MTGPRLTAALACVSALLLCAGVAGAQADAPRALRLIGAETDYYCFRKTQPGQPGGFACDLLQEMARRVGHPDTLDLYPLARAIPIAAVSRNTLIAPVGRIAARETRFAWPIELFTEEFVVVTRRDANVDISSESALRALDIGVVRDGAAVYLLQARNVRTLSLVSHDLLNARKLAMKRIDAWVSPWNAILAAQRRAGLPADQLRRGVVLARVKVYVASSPDVDPAIAAQWKNALDTMRRDGTYDRLARQYHFIPAP